MSNKKIKVLCVDDSALIRSVMTEIINSQSDMTVVGTAADPLVARDLIKVTNPDVLTLDVEMPRMDGLEFLEKLMRLRPMPVVMVSSLTERGSEIALRALELGAIDFVTKPRLGVRDGLLNYTELIAGKIRTAASARLLPGRHAAAPRPGGDAPHESLLRSPLLSTEKLIIIGASTGGTEAIREVLQPLPPDSPAVMIAQHMPAGFTRSFAQRLDGLCRINVKEAEHGERVLPGYAYIAPGGFHLSLGAQRRQLRGPPRPGATGEPPPAVDRRAVRFGGQARGQERHRNHPDRHGQGRRRRPAAHEARGCAHAGAGRGQLRCLRHAARSHRTGRGGRRVPIERSEPPGDGAPSHVRRTCEPSLKNDLLELEIS